MSYITTNQAIYNKHIATYESQQIPPEIRQVDKKYFCLVYSHVKVYQNPINSEYMLIYYGLYNQHRYQILFFSDNTFTKLHRTDGPAIIRYRENDKGKIESSTEMYYENNISHRIKGPQQIELDSGTIMEFYRINGELHNENGPACIKYIKKTKRILWEMYYINGKLHRVDKPARLTYAHDGTITHEVWYKNDEFHRLNGAAIIEKTIVKKTIEKTTKEWYVNGKRIDRRKYPVFDNGILCGRVLLTKRAIMVSAMFDREYGAFLNEQYKLLKNQSK